MKALRFYQRKARAFRSRLKGKAIYGMAPGTGKTLPAIRTAKLPCLVVLRRDDFLTWELELAEEGVTPEEILEIESGDAELPKTLEWPYEWVFVTYDILKTPRMIAWAKTIPFRDVILDEFHMVKRWASQRTKGCYKATRHIPRRLGLSGSIIGNDVKDLYALALMVDDGRTFGDSEWMFMKRYYLRSGHGWYLRRNAKEELSRKLESLVYYVHEDDVLKLPPVRNVLKAVPLSGMQRRHYENLLVEWETELSTGEVIEMNQVIVRLSKLKQVASGFIYDAEKNAHYMKCSKLDMLRDLIEDEDYLGKKPKVVVWCSYTAEIVRIMEMLDEMKLKAVDFYGARNRAEREAARLAFRDDPKLRFFVAQVDAGVGMNELIVSDTALWFSNSLKVLSKQQSIRRTRRSGSEIHDEITNYELVSEGTVDVPLVKDIGKAMTLAHRILAGIRQGVPLRKLLS